MEINELVEMLDEQKEGVLVVRVKGRVDTATASSVEKRLVESINKGNKQLILDFANVSYLSSTGLRAILVVVKKIKSLSGRLIICNLIPNVRDVFIMTGFDQLIQCENSESEAFKKIHH